MKKNNFKIIELKPDNNKSSIRRTVFIKDFIVQEIIGIHEHEKTEKQKIKFNIVVNVNQNTVPDEKNIKSIVDYEKITNKLENLVKNKKYNFLESLAEDSFKEIFEDKRINSVKIKIEKPDAIKNADSVGVEVFKNRSDYEGS
ncbi:MAG TPA: dihydroneopterin aldolase [Pelagibacteraceae bacterium]|jgi:dihydroneopterin aldolase|nr:dihydroneopterin aldolase [Pelagibacteraceae bacterium]|tara:strand:+ start:329 stop:757 length:429 start_codon:yes stop_codon:yes gene_type:complete